MQDALPCAPSCLRLPRRLAPSEPAGCASLVMLHTIQEQYLIQKASTNSSSNSRSNSNSKSSSNSNSNSSFLEDLLPRANGAVQCALKRAHLQCRHQGPQVLKSAPRASARKDCLPGLQRASRSQRASAARPCIDEPNPDNPAPPWRRSAKSDRRSG